MKYTKPKHNVSTWFKDQNLVGFFENNYERNTMGTIKAPKSLIKRFNNWATTTDIEKSLAAIANTAIMVTLTHPKNRKLVELDFETMLLGEHQNELRQMVMDCIQHTLYNNNIWERMNDNNLTTPNFQFTQGTQDWLLSTSVFGQFVKTAITNIQIDKYKWFNSKAEVYKTVNNVQNDLIIVYEDIDTIIVNNIGTYPNLKAGIEGVNLSGKWPERFDYFQVTDSSTIYRYEGGNHLDEENWKLIGATYVQ